MKKLLCWIGWHDWKTDYRDRHCLRCQKAQRFSWGYTGPDTGSWEDL